MRCVAALFHTARHTERDHCDHRARKRGSGCPAPSKPRRLWARAAGQRDHARLGPCPGVQFERRLRGCCHLPLASLCTFFGRLSPVQYSKDTTMSTTERERAVAIGARHGAHGAAGRGREHGRAGPQHAADADCTMARQCWLHCAPIGRCDRCPGLRIVGPSPANLSIRHSLFLSSHLLSPQMAWLSVAHRLPWSGWPSQPQTCSAPRWMTGRPPPRLAGRMGRRV